MQHVHPAKQGNGSQILVSAAGDVMQVRVKSARVTGTTYKADRKPAYLRSPLQKFEQQQMRGQALSLADRFGQTFVREWANEIC
jgi:hypothetical protein